MKTITVNGKKMLVHLPRSLLSFEDLVEGSHGPLADPKDFTVTYKGNSFSGGYVGGSLEPGDKIDPPDGAAFTVVQTDKA
jgi:hypothetical protein